MKFFFHQQAHAHCTEGIQTTFGGHWAQAHRICSIIHCATSVYTLVWSTVQMFIVLFFEVYEINLSVKSYPNYH